MTGYFCNCYARHYAGELPARTAPRLDAPRAAAVPPWVCFRAAELRPRAARRRRRRPGARAPVGAHLRVAGDPAGRRRLRALGRGRVVHRDEREHGRPRPRARARAAVRAGAVVPQRAGTRGARCRCGRRPAAASARRSRRRRRRRPAARARQAPAPAPAPAAAAATTNFPWMKAAMDKSPNAKLLGEKANLFGERLARASKQAADATKAAAENARRQIETLQEKKEEPVARRRVEVWSLRAPLGSVLVAESVVLTPSGQVWAHVTSDGDEDASDGEDDTLESKLSKIVGDETPKRRRSRRGPRAPGHLPRRARRRGDPETDKGGRGAARRVPRPGGGRRAARARGRRRRARPAAGAGRLLRGHAATVGPQGRDVGGLRGRGRRGLGRGERRRRARLGRGRGAAERRGLGGRRRRPPAGLRRQGAGRAGSRAGRGGAPAAGRTAPPPPAGESSDRRASRARLLEGLDAFADEITQPAPARDPVDELDARLTVDASLTRTRAPSLLARCCARGRSIVVCSVSCADAAAAGVVVRLSSTRTRRPSRSAGRAWPTAATPGRRPASSTRRRPAEWWWRRPSTAVWKSNLRRVLHGRVVAEIDDFVKNCRVHPTHWLNSTGRPGRPGRAGARGVVPRGRARRRRRLLLPGLALPEARAAVPRAARTAPQPQRPSTPRSRRRRPRAASPSRTTAALFRRRPAARLFYWRIKMGLRKAPGVHAGGTTARRRAARC